MICESILKNYISDYFMKLFRIIAALGAFAGVTLLTSCGCCTGEEEPIGLRPLPQFGPLPTIDATK